MHLKCYEKTDKKLKREKIAGLEGGVLAIGHCGCLLQLKNHYQTTTALRDHSAKDKFGATIKHNK